MFLKIHEGLRIRFILPSFCDIFIFNVSFSIWSMRNFFEWKTVVNQLYLKKQATGWCLNRAVYSPSCVQGGRYAWFSHWLDFCWEKPSLLERLPHVATWLWQLFPCVRGCFPWALIPSTHMWRRRSRVGPDLLFGTLVFLLCGFESLSCLCLGNYL